MLNTRNWSEKYWPNYDFLNTQTGEQFEKDMSMNEREQYLANNYHIQQLLTRMNMFAGDLKTMTVGKRICAHR